VTILAFPHTLQMMFHDTRDYAVNIDRNEECRCFVYSPAVMPSSPVVTLSSDTIEQVCRENVTNTDLMDLWSLWQHRVEPEMWPYNAIELWLVTNAVFANCWIVYPFCLDTDVLVNNFLSITYNYKCIVYSSVVNDTVGVLEPWP